MRYWVSALLALSISPVIAAPTAARKEFISLQHAGCESRCAVYALTISSDGRAVYVGRFYVRKVGTIVAHVKPADVRAIFEKVAAVDFKLLKQVYRRDAGDCEQWTEDRPTSTLTIASSAISKVVTYNLGCVGPVTSQLAEIEHEMNRAVKIERWIK